MGPSAKLGKESPSSETKLSARSSQRLRRRAERTLVTLSKSEQLAPPLLQYINRLSDLLFVLARVLNRYAGGGDIYWQQGKNRK